MEFQAGQLSNLIIKLEQEQFTGTATLKAVLESGESVSKKFSFWKGAITFVGNHFPSPLEFADLIKQKLNVTFMDAALKVLEGRVKNQDSVRELIDFLSHFGLLKWETFEPWMKNEIVLSLEPLLVCAGVLTLDRTVRFDLSYGYDGYGFSWEMLQDHLVKRQQQWQFLQPITPKTVLSRGVGNGILPEELSSHLETWVDGQRSLASIAAQTSRDPLELAQIYNKLFHQGWISVPSTGIAKAGDPLGATASHRPVILSVDDSPIVQVSIQRAISDRYEVLCAKSAVEALHLLNTRKVELLLLDVTMPDIDGLELCRTIRNIGKFRDLPVIMLTAKDGFIDKVKGQFAGSTHYLTKPVDREKLLPVLEKYVSVPETAA